jgi:ABC-type bacteriocin/lantibiotic exporter with double-glycine peptidase domain
MFRFLAQTVLAWLCLGQIVFAGEQQGVWLDIPFVKQEKNACGAAAVSMVMQYWSRQAGRATDESADPAHIERALYSPQAHGIYNSAIENYLRHEGFRTFALRGDVRDLQQQLEKGRPLIVMLKPQGQTPLHYVVVAGMNPAENVVLVNDPAQRKLLKIDRSTFEKSWNAAGNWTLLALPEQATH